MKAKVFGREFYACNTQCRDGFKEDRRHGAIYGPYRYEDGSFAMNAEEWSMAEPHTCAYCNKEEAN